MGKHAEVVETDEIEERKLIIDRIGDIPLKEPMRADFRIRGLSVHWNEDSK